MLKAGRTLALVRGILIVGTVASFGLTARGLCQTPTAPSPPQSATASVSTATNPAPDDEKRKLELEKLRAEIDNLKADTKKAAADTEKAEWDSSTAWTAWIGPLISVITIFILAATLIAQRKTALDVQEKQGQAALDLQKAEAIAAREIKVVDLVMSSRSPALAQLKAELLGSLEVRSPFLDAVKARTEMHQFPGDLGLELRMKVFEELASKYDEPADIVLLARQTLFGGEDWFEKLVPPKPTPTARRQNS
jgi:hypothetical protein